MENLLGKKTMPRNSHLKWQVTYEPGTLEAIGYKKKKISTKVETTSTPYKVMATTEKKYFNSRWKRCYCSQHFYCRRKR